MKNYQERLIALQTALVAWRQQAIADGRRSVVIFEGRDAAGKDGAIRRIVEHLSIRDTRVVALPKPSDKDRGQWFFQRYIAQLPTAGELVIFNRSWYNRGGVEVVMGFSTPAEQKRFLEQAPRFERMLIEDGIDLIKIWLDIDREEQAERLTERRTDPLKALKTSPLDAVAQEKWSQYSKARDKMLTATHTAHAPWVCVRGNSKKAARIAVISHLLQTLAPKPVLKGLEKPDPKVLFGFEPAAIADGRLAK
jgi:polyphosphate kinase 2